MKRATLGMSSLVLAMVLGTGLGCTSKPDDAKVTSEIQGKFSQDSGLSTKQLTVQASSGVVTLAGAVDNDAQREAAGRQAASVAGVKTVVNNLQVVVASAAVTPTPQPSVAPNSPPAKPPAADKAKPAPGKKSKAQNSSGSAKTKPADANNQDGNQDADQDSNENADNQTPSSASAPDNPPATPADNTAAAPAPPPSPRKLIIDQGTQLTVRLIDPIDSEKNQTGDTFHATLNAPLSSDGEEAVPAGIELTGHLVEVKSAGKFSGQSSVAMQLDSFKSGGQTYSLETDQYKKEGASRGKNTAEKVGGGAILGGIIGAIAGGGKGAAIGGAAGAGAGGAVQAAGKSQQIKLPSETVLNFTLQAPITVVQAPPADTNRPKLDDSK